MVLQLELIFLYKEELCLLIWIVCNFLPHLADTYFFLFVYLQSRDGVGKILRFKNKTQDPRGRLCICAWNHITRLAQRQSAGLKTIINKTNHKWKSKLHWLAMLDSISCQTISVLRWSRRQRLKILSQESRTINLPRLARCANPKHMGWEEPRFNLLHRMCK